MIWQTSQTQNYEVLPTSEKTYLPLWEIKIACASVPTEKMLKHFHI